MTEHEAAPLRPMLGEVQRILKGGNAPTFPVNGPRMLPALQRKSTAVRADLAFQGGEDFRPTELAVETNAAGDGMVVIWLTLQPVSMKHTAVISNVRLPLEKAFEAFEGLESWIATVQPALKSPEPVGVPTGVAPISKEAFRESDAFGAW